MKVEQLLQLINAVSASELTEFKYEENGAKLSLKKADGKVVAVPALTVPPVPAGTVPASAPVAPTVPVPPSNEEPAAPVGEKTPTAGNIVKSPLVGTFYAAPAEDAEPFVKVGDSVKEGQVLAIVEAMKLMNEIESDFTGTVKEILVENGQAVEYGQPLFIIG